MASLREYILSFCAHSSSNLINQCRLTAMSILVPNRFGYSFTSDGIHGRSHIFSAREIQHSRDICRKSARALSRRTMQMQLYGPTIQTNRVADLCTVAKWRGWEGAQVLWPIVARRKKPKNETSWANRQAACNGVGGAAVDRNGAEVSEHFGAAHSESPTGTEKKAHYKFIRGVLLSYHLVPPSEVCLDLQ